MWQAAYGLATRLALPFVLAYFAWRGRREPDYRRHWQERLGRGAVYLDHPIWIHAASVGEVVLATSLVAALVERRPDRSLLVTTMTPTGRAEAIRRFGDQATIAYMPLDTPGATRRFIARIRPSLGIFVETELWPNLIMAANRTGTPLALVNASVSERSAANYARPVIAAALKAMLSCFAFIGAAEPAHADRFESLGAAGGVVAVTGNLKYDQPVNEGRHREARQLRRTWHADQRPVWVAASTHAPEEDELLTVFARLRRRHPTLLLVIVPRHPQRFDDVAGLIEAGDWRLARRSLADSVNEATDIVLVDTLGELPLFYALADVAFVGGSLTPGVGGHNVIEPAAIACPFVTGPHVREWREPLRDLTTAGGAVVAPDAVSLERVLTNWLACPETALRDGRAVRATVERHRGALQRTLEGLAVLLPTDRRTP
ncbi:3-deoxy-D-manno-octulosonic acid transferase [Salinisphaera sp. SPP-AMP-43]|uniref:3-deoxy-D-manno-octulosonic acid transferase n=1 Tax=Salinisphaera sp. SPP-AMP-43 TaxID=3121288 RepID=UPI003C6E1EC5